VSYVTPTQPFLRKGHPLNDGLVAAWLFSEGGGDTTRDLSGRSLHGTLENGPTWVTTEMGTAINVTSENTYVDLPDIPMTQAGSVAGWIRVNDWGSQSPWTAPILRAGSYYGLTFNFRDQGINFRIYDSEASYPSNVTQTTYTTTLGQWHHFVYIYAVGSVPVAYQDGRWLAQSLHGTLEGIDPTNSYNIWTKMFGAAFSSTYNVDCAYVALWNRVLTPAEIRKLAGLDGDPWEQWRPYPAISIRSPRALNLVTQKPYAQHRLVNAAGAHRTEKTVTFTGGSDPVTLFTVTGDVIVRIVPVVTSGVASSAGANVRLGITGNTDAMIADTPAADLDAGELWLDVSPDSEIESADSIRAYIISGGNDIVLTPDDTVDSGSIVFHCYWSPLSTDGKVEAA